MSARQLRLLAHAQPLLSRMGKDFFRSVPACPGVYVMRSETGRVLYVGQSKNLRQRLGTYRRANPDHTPRKIIRLVFAVRDITWETCETALQARQRELELLQLHRPKFNAANVWPKAYRFIGWQTQEQDLLFQIVREEPPRPGFYGAFKPSATWAYAALLRLLWTALHQPLSPHDFPRELLAARPPAEYAFKLERLPATWNSPDLEEALHHYFAGRSAALVDRLIATLPLQDRISAFQHNLHLADLTTLAEFFERGPKRNGKLCTERGLPAPVIPAERLDFWLLEEKGKTTAAAPGD